MSSIRDGTRRSHDVVAGIIVVPIRRQHCEYLTEITRKKY